jgi:hypothetical protein|tara:strand:- start:334 stop:483 length:150 start_codon:yes stop_codon:yes gene_type:complete
MIQKNKKLRPLSHLEKRLFLRKWAKSQEGSMARKLWESKQFLKSIGIKT